MGLRSYLLVDDGQGFSPLLEANNVQPLYWLAMMAPSDISEGFDTRGPSMQLVDGPAGGVNLSAAAALKQLATRRMSLLPWLDPDAAIIFDEFCAFLAAQEAQRFRLDLAEWLNAANNKQEALDELLLVLEALACPPPKTLPVKRKPARIKWLMSQYGLHDYVGNPAVYSYALGGASALVPEPWRREQPRDRRLPGDKLCWSNGDPVLNDGGRTIIVKVKNSKHLETPFVWARDGGKSVALLIDAAIGHLHVNVLSENGRVMFGSCQCYPGPVNMTFGHDGTQFYFLHEKVRPSGAIQACSADGRIAVGWHDTGHYDDGSERAFFWPLGGSAVEFLDSDAPSKATHISPDGVFIAGVYAPSDEKVTFAPKRGFVWSQNGGMSDLGVNFFSLDWLALSPDGERGVVKSIKQRGSPTLYWFWQRGQPLRPIEDETGSPLTQLCISAAVDAVLGCAGSDEEKDNEILLLWNPELPLQRIAMPGVGSLRPLLVTNGGNAIIAALEDKDTRAEREMLIWSQRDGLRRSMLEHGGKLIIGGFWAHNRSTTLDNFVAVGRRRSDSFPYIWTVVGGIEFHPEGVA